MIYYVKNYYSGALIYTSNNFTDACDICKLTPGTIVTDDNNNSYFLNIELPF